jgi:hypothetical protein
MVSFYANITIFNEFVIIKEIMNNLAEKIDTYTSDLNSHTKELICKKGKLAVLVAALGYFVDVTDSRHLYSINLCVYSNNSYI